MAWWRWCFRARRCAPRTRPLPIPPLKLRGTDATEGRVTSGRGPERPGSATCPLSRTSPTALALKSSEKARLGRRFFGARSMWDTVSPFGLVSTKLGALSSERRNTSAMMSACVPPRFQHTPKYVDHRPGRESACRSIDKPALRVACAKHQRGWVRWNPRKASPC